MTKVQDHLTLKEFHKKYYPQLSQRKLSDLMGISENLFCKIKKGEYRTTTPKAKIIAEWMWYNHKVVLIPNDPKYQAELEYEEKYHDIIREKDEKIAKLEDQVRDLSFKLAFSDQANGVLTYLERRAENNIKKRRKTGGK